MQWFNTIGLFGDGELIAYLIVANSLLPFLPRKTCIQGGLCLKIGCLVKKKRRAANARVGDKEGVGREGGGVVGGENLRVGSGPCLRRLSLRSSLALAVGR